MSGARVLAPGGELLMRPDGRALLAESGAEPCCGAPCPAAGVQWSHPTATLCGGAVNGPFGTPPLFSLRTWRVYRFVSSVSDWLMLNYEGVDVPPVWRFANLTGIQLATPDPNTPTFHHFLPRGAISGDPGAACTNTNFGFTPVSYVAYTQVATWQPPTWVGPFPETIPIALRVPRNDASFQRPRLMGRSITILACHEEREAPAVSSMSQLVAACQSFVADPVGNIVGCPGAGPFEWGNVSLPLATLTDFPHGTLYFLVRGRHLAYRPAPHLPLVFPAPLVMVDEMLVPFGTPAQPHPSFGANANSICDLVSVADYWWRLELVGAPPYNVRLAVQQAVAHQHVQLLDVVAEDPL